jgi:lysophospholipase L1-like esterase
MTAPHRFLAAAVTVLLTMAGLVGLGTLPAAAQNAPTINYVALGDSYAAGQGAGPYSNECLQSSSGYPTLLDGQEGVKLRRNVTCTGATTGEVIGTQLSALNPGTRLVTLTVGANDLHVAQIGAACLSGFGAACQAAIKNARVLLQVPPGGVSVLAAHLADTYTAITGAAPKALILVTGYPYLFETPSRDNPNFNTILAVNQATAQLNATIAGVAETLRAEGMNITYVDVTGGFAGHGIGSATPYLNVAGEHAFHPNAAGYAVYAAALTAALPTKHALVHSRG